MGFGSGVVDPETGIHYQNRGSLLQPRPGPPERPRAAASGRSTRCCPGCCSAAGDGPWIVAGSMGGDAQPQIHAQFVSALVDGGVDIATAVAAPRWFVEPAEHFAPPVDVRAEPRFAPGVARGARGARPPGDRTEPFDCGLGHEHAIELVDGGPARRLARRRHRPAQRGPARRLVAPVRASRAVW